MGTLAGQTIAASYEQVLHVDRDGGGNGTTLVNVKDGDNGTTFCLQLSTRGAQIVSPDTGDAYLNFVIPGGAATNTVVMGIDNSDGDKFKIHRATSFGTGTALTDAITIANDGSVAIGDASHTGGFHFAVHSGTNDSTAFFKSSDAQMDIKFADSNSTGTNKLTCTGNNLALFTNGTTRITVLESGYVGIGTTTPATTLEVYGQILVDDTCWIDHGGITKGFAITVAESSSWERGFSVNNFAQDAGLGGYHCYGSGSGVLTRLTIGESYNDADGISWLTATGYCGIGTTTPDYKLKVVEDKASGYSAIFINDGDNNNRHGIAIRCGADDGNTSSATTYILAADGNGSTIGSINHETGGDFDITTTSDSRLKENIVDTQLDGLSLCNQIKVREFNWKEYKGSLKNRAGFIAQEVASVYPEAATGTDGAMKTEVTVEAQAEAIDEDGNITQEKIDEVQRTVIDPMGITKGAFIPIMMKAIQQLSDKVTALENA